MNHHELEEGFDFTPDFEKLNLISGSDLKVLPVIIQDETTKEVLILGYTNLEALQYSIKERIVAFWSTSRNELWIKGAKSGEYLDLVEIRTNCEQNSFLYLVKIRKNGACHTKNQDGTFRKSCYYRKINGNRKLDLIKIQ